MVIGGKHVIYAHHHDEPNKYPKKVKKKTTLAGGSLLPVSIRTLGIVRLSVEHTKCLEDKAGTESDASSLRELDAEARC